MDINLKWKGASLDPSGYGCANRDFIFALHKAGMNITIEPWNFEAKHYTLYGELGALVDRLKLRNIEYDRIVHHYVPNNINKYYEIGKKNIGFSAWETEQIPKHWVPQINKMFDLQIVPSKYNKRVYKQSGVEIPIMVIPHCFNQEEFANAKPIDMEPEVQERFKFLSVFQWCYDAKTRVLTTDGFKYFKDLSYEDKIATLNLETEELEYHKPKRIVKFKRKDTMIKIKSNMFNMCVTPNHKMVVKHHQKTNFKYKLVPLNEILSVNDKKEVIIASGYQAKKNCIWNGKEKPYFIIPKVGNSYPKRKGIPNKINMDTFLEFFGWFLSEGSAYIQMRNGEPHRNIVEISQEKKKYRLEIINCITNMGFTPLYDSSSHIVFNSRELCHYLTQFGNQPKRYIPKWIKNLSGRQINILLTSLVKGGSSIYNNGLWIKYVTTSKRLAEDILECLLKVGKSGAINTEDPTKKKPGALKDGRIINGKLLQYIISVNHKQTEPEMCYANIEEIEEYDGYIYCATVPNHNMLVERNGKVVFSGNTERKNPLGLLKAYYTGFYEQKDVILIIKAYGLNQSEKEQQRLAFLIDVIKKELQLDPNKCPPVLFIGSLLSKKQIVSLYKACDCFVLPTRSEGFGMPFAEACAAGMPIVAPNYGGQVDFLDESFARLTKYQLTPVAHMSFPYYIGTSNWSEPDLIDFRDSMRYFYETNKHDPILFASYRKKAKEMVQEKLSYEIIGEKFKKIIEGV